MRLAKLIFTNPIHPRRLALLACLAAPLLIAVSSASGQELSATALFRTQVQPLLQKRCLGCHGVDHKFGRLDLRTREAALKGGVRGPAFVPGAPDKSLLVRMVHGHATPRMPPQEKLPPSEIALIERWIAAGAPWDGQQVASAEKQVWWSFRPPVRPPVPKVAAAGWAKTPIDAFILERFQREGIKPSPPASRRALIRRATFDVTGLPPTPEEIDAFERDPRPGAYERVVDRLLASPHYGERWARHWLDVVRFAESSGFEGDKDRPDAWRYRDWVINAFNIDYPYDLFLRDQLAGDELRPGDHGAVIATGYLALGVEDFAMAKLPQTRADELDDLVSTTGSAMLGLTVGCARCHDHKYDPISQEDYYRLSAIFAPSKRKEWPIPTPQERWEVDQHNAAVEQELEPLRARLAPLKEKGAAAARAAGTAMPAEAQIKAALTAADQKIWDETAAAIAAVEAKRRQYPKAMAVTDEAAKHPAAHLLIRGDANQKGPEVQPGFLRSLPGGEAIVTPAAATPTSTGRRRALANWIASPENPLTARVWVNRVWQHHFGRGLVATSGNFGFNGAQPSHPELLDWLATAFMSGDWGSSAPGAPAGSEWRTKPLHRLILLSSVYRQSSSAHEAGEAADPENLLLWRMPVRRLEAEAVRDAILTAAGSLNREMGGPPVYPPVDPSLRSDTFQGINWPEGEDSPRTWRRSVYIKVKRSLIFPLLEVFDRPEITASVAQRNVTVTPNQALTMLNSPLVLRQAELFAARVKSEGGPEAEDQVDRAYLLALGRRPAAGERAASLAYLSSGPPDEREARLTEFCHAILNLNEFVYVP